MRNLIFILFIMLIVPFLAFSQNKKTHIREGNKLYKENKFNDAEIEYRKSLELEKQNNKAIFNLGDALYKQEQYDSAAAKFAAIANQNHDRETTAKAYHNLGNALLKNKKYQESIDAYKKSLRLDPKDMDTKYNLEYAKRMMIAQQQQQQQKNQNKDNKDNQDKNKQDQQQQDNKDNQDKNKQDQQQQQQDKISKEDAKRILQALDQDDKKLQKKTKKAKPVRVKPEKQW